MYLEQISSRKVGSFMIDTYYITNETLLITPIDENKTKIIEMGGCLIINKNILKIIDESCRYFGSSYEGRCAGTKAMINTNYKLPIIIDEFSETIFFPTSSIRSEKCSWVSIKNIINYYKNGKETIAEFQNNICQEIKISFSSFEMQVFRATMLAMVLKKRKK